MMWDFQSLYTKSKAYVRKGLEHEDPDSPEIPLWVYTCSGATCSGGFIQG